MKSLGLLALAWLTAGAASAQQPSGQPPAGAAKPSTCLSQYSEAPAFSPALLINTGFEIKGSVPGGLWLQKEKEVYFCNSGRAAEGEVLCWKLRIPVRGQPC